MRTPVVVITGASSGIGAQIARTFADHGFQLVLLSRNAQAIENLKIPNSHAFPLDVADSTSFQDRINLIESDFGPISCLINCAGTVLTGDFTQSDLGKIESLVQVNLMGVMNGMHAVLPGMRTRRSGTIINISSLSDRNSRPNVAAYAASKAAVKSLTESLRMGNAAHGIRITNIAPGVVKTPMIEGTAFESVPSISAEDLAKSVLFIYEQPSHVCIRDMVVAASNYEP